MLRAPILHQILLPVAKSLFLVVFATTTLFVSAENVPDEEEKQSATSTGNANQPPVLGKVGRNGAYGYSQTIGSGFSFSSSGGLTEDEMEEGLEEFRSDNSVVWLYYSADASDPDGDEVRYIWSQESPEEPVAIIEQEDFFVPGGQAVQVKVCIPPPGAEITLQVVAIDKSGARSEPRSVVVEGAGCASESDWVALTKFSELRDSANQGDQNAQTALAYAYVKGTGVYKSEKKGTELMQMYAKAGNPEAQTEWGYFHFTGEHGIKKNSEESKKWYRAAALQGHSHGQFVMGLLVEDKQEALRWYTLSAEQNHYSAQFELAKILAEGDGVPRDVEAAKAWMQKSKDRGHERAKTWIENWEVATTFDESGNRPPQLASVAYTGDERPTSVSYSADSMTYKDGKWVTEGGQSRTNTKVWRKITVRAEDFDAETIRYLVTQISPETPQASIGGTSGAFKYHSSGTEVIFAVCFPQISGGEFTFQVIAEDKRGAKSDPKTIMLEAIRSEQCQ